MNKHTPCQGCWSAVNDYADGRLKGRRLKAAEEHLAACAACRDLLVEAKRLRDVLAEETVPTASPAFWEGCFEAAAAAAPAPRPRGSRWWKPAVVLATSAAAAAVSLVWLLPPSQPPVPLPSLTAPAATAPSPYVMRHAEFDAGHPLRTSSHYLLLAARTEGTSGLGWQSESVELANDGQGTGGR
jgi:anti-sigma factor RsiW